MGCIFAKFFKKKPKQSVNQEVAVANNQRDYNYFHDILQWHLAKLIPREETYYLRLVCKTWYSKFPGLSRYEIAAFFFSHNLNRQYEAIVSKFYMRKFERKWPEPKSAAFICEYAARNNKLEILESAIEKGYYWSNEVTWRLAYSENIVLLDLMRNSKRDYVLKDKNWIIGAVYYAINHGKLTVAKWALNHGLLGIHAMYWAAAGDQLKVLKWLKRIKFDWDERAIDIAKERGHTKLLDWMEKNRWSDKRERSPEFKVTIFEEMYLRDPNPSNKPAAKTFYNVKPRRNTDFCCFQ